MIKLFTEKEYNTAKSTDKLALCCKQCNKTFYYPKNTITSVLKGNPRVKLDYCSLFCLGKSQKKTVVTNCGNCGTKVERRNSEISKSKSKKLFCSRSCAATYNNTHKTTGTRVSKLEVYLQNTLPKLFPNLEIHFNRKDTINSELDIYIPSLKLAFELNGIFHYEPIFGNDKLTQIQNNDHRKFQACLEHNIELCLIDVSSLKYFKEKNAQKYLEIICNIIKQKVIHL